MVFPYDCYPFVYLSVAPLASGQTVTVVQPGKSLLASTAIRVQPGLLSYFSRNNVTFSTLRTVPVAKRAPEEENEVLEPCLCAFHNAIVVYSAYTFCPCTNKVFVDLEKRLNE